ncbi:MAG TPA: HlyD family efflux transporter periplasmic adaptor subunit [Longimicrobium sp.]|nr:HlyD family efflux transporter periplasmic adaptor subunit [Longimicrobium sp.]
MTSRGPEPPTSTTPPAASAHKLLLPEVASPDVVGGRWVSRAVSLTLTIFTLLLAAGTVAASLIRLKVTVDGAGVLQPTQVWAVRGEETGVVRDVLVRMGDTVRAGQAIAHLDTLQLASSLEQLRARRRALELEMQLARTSAPLEVRSQAEKRAQADAELVRARAALRQRLVEYGFNPDIDEVRRTYRVGTHIAIDEGLASLMAAEAAARSARVDTDKLGLQSIDQSRQQQQLAEIDFQVATLQQRLSHLTLHAPAAGIVLTDGLERLPGKVLQEGETLLEVSEDDDWRAALLVAERDVSRIRVGDDVQVELKAFGRVNAPEIRGKVLTVGAEPTPGATDAGNRMFPVMVRLNRQDLAEVGVERLRRGYTAQAKIVTRSERLIVLIWEYLLRRSEEVRDKAKQRTETGKSAWSGPSLLPSREGGTRRA